MVMRSSRLEECATKKTQAEDEVGIVTVDGRVCEEKEQQQPLTEAARVAHVHVVTAKYTHASPSHLILMLVSAETSMRK